MTIWETLGITPTADLTLIRRAYAAQTRHCHPEDDPEGFQTLHDAYQTALELVRRMGQMPSAAAQQGPAAGPEAMDISALIARGLEQQRRWRVRALLARLSDLCDRSGEPSFYYEWKKCLESEEFRDLMSDRDLLAGLRGLVETHRALPQGACLALYFAYGLRPEDRDHPLCALLESRVPATRQPGHSFLSALRLRCRPRDLGKVAVWLAASWLLCVLPFLLALSGAGLLLYCAAAQAALAGASVLLRRWRSRRRAGWQCLLPGRGRVTLVAVCLGAAGAASLWGAAQGLVSVVLAAVWTLAVGAVHLLAGEMVCFGPEGVELYLPQAWGRLVRWEELAEVRQVAARCGPALKLRFSDGTGVRLSLRHYGGCDRLREAVECRGIRI